MTARIRLFAIIFLHTVCFFSCDNPFFPPLSKPTKSFHPRATPQGVIRQLVESYESKRLDLYEDLLADSFHFYVAPTFIYQYGYAYELPDTVMNFLSGSPSYYYYWTKLEELKSHRNLFSSNNSISFSAPFTIMNVRYISDKNGDTSNVEIKTSRSTLNIDITQSNQIVKYIVDIKEQVFLLEKDKAGLWVIRKWYDQSDASNSIN
jgi:hypothetical protein